MVQEVVPLYRTSSLDAVGVLDRAAGVHLVLMADGQVVFWKLSGDAGDKVAIGYVYANITSIMSREALAAAGGEVTGLTTNSASGRLEMITRTTTIEVASNKQQAVVKGSGGSAEL